MNPNPTPGVSPDYQSPIAFAPIYQERVWGGRMLEKSFGRQLPTNTNVGESWECVDRPEARSVVRLGATSGLLLNTLWKEHRVPVFGPNLQDSPDFPLLIKILDARANLSVQVHPSGKENGGPLGEPKNEWWYVLDALPEAFIYAGFKAGVSQREITEAMELGTLEPLLHKLRAKKGDSIFIPGGRCHAIGAGCLIAEVQQNSDTTFRMFDWNRTDSQGASRPLHKKESLACLNFNDHEPELAPPLRSAAFHCDFFTVKLLQISRSQRAENSGGALLQVLSGTVHAAGTCFHAGDLFLLPAAAESVVLTSENGTAELLQVNLPRTQPL